MKAVTKRKAVTRPPALRLAIDPSELIIDSFAGGGGASVGIEIATGRSPDIAINHDAEALAMHKVNHPETKHYIEDVWKVDPRKVTKGKRVALMWLSPDCKHFSKAKGSKPVEKKIRGLAWLAPYWAKALGKNKPRVIILENVEEFAEWGPLIKRADGKWYPDPTKKGLTFRRFVKQLRNLGYEVDWQQIIASDMGAPTIRRRLFLVARCDGLPIIWPDATHSKAGKGGLEKWLPAADHIDFSLPTPSIFERKRDLADNTMARIARGVWKYVINSADPFIVPLTHQGDTRVNGIDEPFPTITGAHRGEHAIIQPSFAGPFIAGVGGRMGQTLERDVLYPAQTLTGKADAAIVAAVIGKWRGQSPGSSPADPLHTITGGPKENPAGAAHAMGLLTPVLTRIGQQNGNGDYINDVRDPVTTITSKGEHLLVAPTLINTRNGEDKNRNGGAGQEPRTFDPKQPYPTITAQGSQGALVAALLAKHFGGHETPGARVDDPAPTITAQDHNALVTADLLAASSIVKFKGTSKHGQDITEPLHTIQTGGGRGGGHYAEVRAFLMKYHRDGGQLANLKDPAPTVRTHDAFGLVTVAGQQYAIQDIGMRMLQPRELFGCQGFPANYKIEFDEHGTPFTKSAQVRMCGNSVCPPVAAAIVRAQFIVQDEGEAA